jgi:hypothetical protein
MDFEHLDKISQVPKPWFVQLWTYIKPQVLRFELYTLQWSCSQSCVLSGNVQVCSSSMESFWVCSVGNVLHHLPGQSLQTLFWPTLTRFISQNIGIWTILPVRDLLQIIHRIRWRSCIFSEIPDVWDFDHQSMQKIRILDLEKNFSREFSKNAKNDWDVFRRLRNVENHRNFWFPVKSILARNCVFCPNSKNFPPLF